MLLFTEVLLLMFFTTTIIHSNNWWLRHAGRLLLSARLPCLEQKPIDDQLDGQQCWWVFVQAIPFPPILVQGVKVLMAAIHLPMEDEPSFFELVILAPGLVYFAFCALHVTYFIPLLIVLDPVLLNFAIHGHRGDGLLAHVSARRRRIKMGPCPCWLGIVPLVCSLVCDGVDIWKIYMNSYSGNASARMQQNLFCHK